MSVKGYIKIAPPAPEYVVLPDGKKIQTIALPAGKGKKAWIYNYFKPYQHDTNFLYCQLCMDEGDSIEPINCKGSSLTGPVKHLWGKHFIVDTQEERNKRADELKEKDKHSMKVSEY